MKAQKDIERGTWYIQFYYKNCQGENRKKFKRGFRTKGEAEAWARDFLQVQKAELDIYFKNFLEIYYQDMENRLRESTLRTKQYIMEKKIIPYFGELSMDKIKASNIRAWQNTLMKQGYSQTYLRTINNQLSAIFNYAMKYYDLKDNPCRKAGSIGKGQAEEMSFWTKREFFEFVDYVKNKPKSYMAFKVLYWTGIRIGELMALTSTDIDLINRKITINKSYQRLDQKDIISPPKTPKGNRVISIPKFLAEELEHYMNQLYGIMSYERIFHFTKHFLTSEMVRGTKKSGVKKIRLHDLRHSHASLLIEMGFTALAIAERLGHEQIETTLNTYSHLYPNKQGELADRLDEEFLKEEVK